MGERMRKSWAIKGASRGASFAEFRVTFCRCFGEQFQANSRKLILINGGSVPVAIFDESAALGNSRLRVGGEERE